MKAYKVFNPDWTCRDFQYEVGKTYKHDGNVELCGSGFHACLKAADCFNYYSFDSDNKVAEVELSGTIIQGGDKIVCSEITIVREIIWQEVLELVNVGKNNTGNSNSGNSNSGYWNSGNSNSGYWNSGHRNSGDWNSGHSNSGDWNSGHSNSGDWNSGDWNSGHSNSGDWNSCNNEAGFFNSKQDHYIRVFNKKCLRSIWDSTEKPSFIYNIGITYIEEGELKTRTYKEAWQEAWNNATDKDKQLLYALPNFSWKVFTEITGIEEDEK